MKVALVLLVVLLLAQFSFAEEFFGDENSEEAADGTASQQQSQADAADVGPKLEDATTTGVEPVDQALKFLGDASPFLLLVIGIILIILSGFGKLLGIILVVLALIRFLWMFL